MGYRNKNKATGVPTFNDLVNQDLKTGKFKPVYVFAGEDALRIKEVVAWIRKKALSGGAGGDFNFHSLAGDQTQVGEILQKVLMLPMFGGLQVIWVKNADVCLADATGATQLEAYLANPVKETILILSMDSLDKRRKWIKSCISKGYLFDFTPPSGEALIKWVLKAAQREKLPLGYDEAIILCDLVGNDLMSLKNEIDKLSLLAEERGRALDAEELRQVIMDQAQLEGFEITAKLEPGQAGEVLKTWFRLAEWGKSPYEISPLIVSRIRKGHSLSVCRQADLGDREIAARTGASPYSFRFLEPMTRAMGTAGLRSALAVALECDRKLKSSPLKPALILEKAIMEFCRRK